MLTLTILHRLSYLFACCSCAQTKQYHIGQIHASRCLKMTVEHLHVNPAVLLLWLVNNAAGKDAFLNDEDAFFLLFLLVVMHSDNY